MRFLEVHLEVDNLERSVELYSKIIPHKRIKHWSNGTAVALILNDDSAFGLWVSGTLGVHNGRGGVHVHFAFQIKHEEYESYKTTIVDAGLIPLEHTWPDGNKSIYFFDYDGHQGEFMTKDWSKEF